MKAETRRSREAKKQKSRKAKNQRNREAKKQKNRKPQRSREQQKSREAKQSRTKMKAETRRSREAKKQKSRKAKNQRNKKPKKQKNRKPQRSWEPEIPPTNPKTEKPPPPGHSLPGTVLYCPVLGDWASSKPKNINTETLPPMCWGHSLGIKEICWPFFGDSMESGSLCER